MFTNHLRAGFNMLELTMATAIFAVVTMVATASITTGTGLTNAVTQSSNAMGTTHRTTQSVSADLRYSDFNKIFLDNSAWKSTASAYSPRYFSFKRCTGFQSVAAGSSTTMASLDRMVLYGEGVILRFAPDPADYRLGILTETIYALDASGALGSVLQQDVVLAKGLAWKYYPTAESTTPVDGFDIVDITNDSIASGVTLTAAQGSELRMKVATVSDTTKVRPRTTVFEMANVRLTQTSIYLRSTQFDRFGLEAPVITSATTASGSVGASFIYDIIATNDPTSFGATGLPSGLSLDTRTGRISGTPLAGGTTSVTITAANGVGTASALVTIAIAGEKPTITSVLTYSLQVGSTCDYQITATAPTAEPVTSFNATGLPSGLSLGTAGAIVGQGSASMIPSGSTSSSYNVTISAGNVNGTTSATLVLTVTQGPPPAPVITSLLSATGTVGVFFAYDITASGSPSSYSATNLPAGLSCSAQGRISGIPTATTLSGGQSVTISATNATGTGTATLVIVINAAPIPVISETATTWAYNQGDYFTYQIIASNSPTSYRISKPSGVTWMYLDTATGRITGTITVTTGGTISLYASNAYGESAAKEIQLSVTAQPSPTVTSETKSAQVNTPFTYTIVASNAPTGYAVEGCPSWLTLSGNTLSGTPTSASLANTTAYVTLHATNAYSGVTGTGTLTINIGPDPNLPTVTLSSKTIISKASTGRTTVDYYSVTGTLSGKAGATLDAKSFSCTVTPSTLNSTVTQNWNGNTLNSGNTFTVEVPVAGTSTFTITASITDSAGRVGTTTQTY